MIMDLCQDRLEQLDKNGAIALLNNPAFDPAFADWREVIVRLDAVRVLTKEFLEAGGKELGK
jgi:hypothetical protein